MKKTIICAVMFGAMAGPAMADLGSAVKAGRYGKWTVLRDIDKMTDKVSCTGVQGDKYEIQLSSDTLFARVSGGVESVTLRFDQKPAQRMRLAKEMEKKVRAVIIDGSEFSEALDSNRILMEIGTLVSGIKTIEIDSTGIKEAVKFIADGCPLQQGSNLEVQAPAESSKTSAPEICTPELKNRMKLAGIKPSQIAKACE